MCLGFSIFIEIDTIKNILITCKTMFMKKSQAIQLITSKIHLDLVPGNTRFANVGVHKNSWWIEPSDKSLHSGFYMVLNDESRNKFLLFKIPSQALKKSDFRHRDDKGAAQIIIPISNSRYVDRKGFDLTKYLIKEIEY
jgi:hypothetical protein